MTDRHPATVPAMTRRSCREANDWSCKAPANLDGPVEATLVKKCYSCGEDVCIAFGCSDLVRYRNANGQQVRMCWTCILEREDYGEVQVQHDEAFIAAWGEQKADGTLTGPVHVLYRPRAFDLAIPEAALCGKTAPLYPVPVAWNVFSPRSRCKPCAAEAADRELMIRIW
jgi:hypothetical protein